jgi:hypothetical protein
VLKAHGFGREVLVLDDVAEPPGVIAAVQM